MNALWQLLYDLQHTSSQCIALTQSTHSTEATKQVIVYGGNCLQAALISLYSHGQDAWEFLT